MKKICLTFILLLFSVTASFPNDLKKDVTINRLAPDLFCIVHMYPWPSNSLVAVMENSDILIIDTPYTPEAAGAVLEWIDKMFGKRKIIAINTHFHVDRLGGNAALVKRNIPVYSSELTPAAIKTRGEDSIKLTESWVTDESMKMYYHNFKYVYPTKIFDSKKGLTLNFGKERAEIRFLGAGHSVDNLFVFLPEKKLIFGGCAILPGNAKGNGNVSDGNVDEWKKTIRRIDTTGYEIVVPGHGAVGGVELIAHTKEMLDR